MAAPALIALGVVMVAAPIINSVFQLFPPLGAAWRKTAFQMYSNLLPEVVELIDMYHKEVITESQFKTAMGEQGIDNEWASRLLESSKQYLAAGDYVALLRRGELTEAEFAGRLAKLHIGGDTLDDIMKASEVIPGPQDLIRFAVREVFSPSIASKYGLFTDFPAQFEAEAAKIGMSPTVARNYWAAHWELPSISQGYEMLHRGVIDDSTLMELLRAKDVMPYWRDKVKAVSYRPLTRVDVRRMYDMGVLDEDAVKRAYLDIGYDEHNATLMTEFTTLFESDETTGLTRSAVIEAYVNNIITASDMQGYLQELGYTERIVSFWLQQAEYDKSQKAMRELERELKGQYKLGMITASEIRRTLGGLNMSSEYVDDLLNNLRIDITESTKLPSKSDLISWFKDEIIPEAKFYALMRQIGYRDDLIEFYMASILESGGGGGVKYMSPAVYQRWLKSGIITEGRFIEVMTDAGFSEDDISAAIAEVAKRGNKS